jgi:hypothetical protein
VLSRVLEYLQEMQQDFANAARRYRFQASRLLSATSDVGISTGDTTGLCKGDSTISLEGFSLAVSAVGLSTEATTGLCKGGSTISLAGIASAISNV